MSKDLIFFEVSLKEAKQDISSSISLALPIMNVEVIERAFEFGKFEGGMIR